MPPHEKATKLLGGAPEISNRHTATVQDATGYQAYAVRARETETPRSAAPRIAFASHST